MVFEFNAFVAFLLALVLGMGVCLIGYIISRSITPFKHYAMKRERFECANPSVGKARGWFMMQYYCYLIIFLTIEPIMIFFFLILLADRAIFFDSIRILLGIILILLPPLIFGLDAAKRLELWRSVEVEPHETGGS